MQAWWKRGTRSVWAEERSRPEKSPDTLLHIKERASDTIISLGCESPTLLIKTRLLNHPLIFPFPLFTHFITHFFFWLQKGGNEGQLVEDIQKSINPPLRELKTNSWKGCNIHLLLSRTDNRCATCHSRAGCEILRNKWLRGKTGGEDLRKGGGGTGREMRWKRQTALYR